MDRLTLCIEVSDKITKAALVSKRGTVSSMHKSMYFETPPQTVLDGQITAPEVFSSTLKEKLANHGMAETKDVIFVLTSPKIVSRKISLPPVKERQIDSIISANASTYFPIDLASYQISYTMLENIEGDKPGFRVMVMAVPKQLMSSYEKLAELSGLELQSFDVYTNSQYQLFHDLNVAGVTMFISLGSRQSIATFMQNNALLLQHAMPFGGDEYLNLALPSVDRDQDKYSYILDMSDNPTWVGDNIPRQRFEEVSARFAGAVTRMIDFFKSSNRNMDIERIILVDTCSGIAGIKKALAAETGVDVYTIEDIAGYGAVIAGSKVGFYVSIASAMIKPLDANINNAKKSKTGGMAKKARVSSKTATMTFFIGFLLLSLGIGAYGGIYYFISFAENSAAQNRIEELAYVQEAYDLYLEYDVIRENFELLEEQAVGYNAGLRDFLEELEQKMPSRLLLLSASCDEFGVTLNITTSTMEDAAMTLSQLRSFETIKHLSIGGVSEDAGDGGVPIVTFSVVCAYELPETEQVTTPTEGEELSLEEQAELDLDAI